jgi:predicted DsbA family dithiol-disulfide isomerase
VARTNGYPAMSEPDGNSQPAKVRIDFVSDVSCPWCAVGLKSLESALQNLDGKITADIHFQPFELNLAMPAEGEDVAEHIRKKYGSTPAQFAQNQENIRARGEALGFVFNLDQRRRIYNTFDAHRLLHWAETEGHQQELKHALLRAYFTDGENVGSHDVLVRIAGEVGLSTERARAILDSDEFAEAVSAQEKFYVSNGINAVPAVVINSRHLISGGQPPEVFENALKQIVGIA